MPSCFARSLLAVLALALASASSGCRERTEDANTLRLGYSPDDMTSPTREDAYEALRGYLARATGHPVDLVPIASYQPAIESIRSGEVDIRNFGSFAYIIAARESAVEAFASRGQPDGTLNTYHSVIIASRDAPWSDVEEALAELPSLKLSFTNPASTSGYLIAREFFRSRGIDAQEVAGEISFSNSHALSVLSVTHGDVDLACVSDTVLEDLVRKAKVAPDAVRILWRSDPIPKGPVAYRAGLDESVKRAIREAYYNLPTAEPATWALVASLYPEERFVYIPSDLAAYDALRDLVPTQELALD